MTTNANARTTPQAVSAALRRAGWQPVPRNRAGVHVTSNFHGACVTADWDSDRESERQAPQIKADLEAAGYTVHALVGTPTVMHVTKEG